MPRAAIIMASESPSNGLPLWPAAPRARVRDADREGAVGGIALPAALDAAAASDSILTSPSASRAAPSSRAASLLKLNFSAMRPCLASSA